MVNQRVEIAAVPFYGYTDVLQRASNHESSSLLRFLECAVFEERLSGTSFVTFEEMCVYVYMHVYIYIYTHTYIYIHT